MARNVDRLASKHRSERISMALASDDSWIGEIGLHTPVIGRIEKHAADNRMTITYGAAHRESPLRAYWVGFRAYRLALISMYSTYASTKHNRA